MDLRDASLTASAVIPVARPGTAPRGRALPRNLARPGPAGRTRPPRRRSCSCSPPASAATGIAFDAAELWLWHAGAPLTLRLSPDGHVQAPLRLGPGVAHGEALQGMVPEGVWQAAATDGAWTTMLLRCRPGLPLRGIRACANRLGTRLRPRPDASGFCADHGSTGFNQSPSEPPPHPPHRPVPPRSRNDDPAS